MSQRRRLGGGGGGLNDHRIAVFIEIGALGLPRRRRRGGGRLGAGLARLQLIKAEIHVLLEFAQLVLKPLHLELRLLELAGQASHLVFQPVDSQLGAARVQALRLFKHVFRHIGRGPEQLGGLPVLPMGGADKGEKREAAGGQDLRGFHRSRSG